MTTLPKPKLKTASMKLTHVMLAFTSTLTTGRDRETGLAYNNLLSSRRWMKAVQQFGWTIGGIVVAYSAAGAAGVIALQISMLITATLAAAHFRSTFGTDLVGALDRGMMFRGGALILLIVATQIDSMLILIMSGVLSGMFVGTWWPSFFELQRRLSPEDDEESSLTNWNMQENGLGVVLPIVSAVLIVLMGEPWVITITLPAIAIAYARSRGIRYGRPLKSHATSTWTKPTLNLTLIYCLLEGMATAAFVMSGRLNLITETVDTGLEGIISLGLVAAFAMLCGSVVSGVKNKFGKDKDTSSLRVIASLTVIAAVIPITLLDLGWVPWLALYLIGRFAISAMYPMTISKFRASANDSGVDPTAIRELYRNGGRAMGALTCGGIWLFFDPSLSFLPCIIAFSVYFIISIQDLLEDKNGTN